MSDFWGAWAANEAKKQYLVYREGPVPRVLWAIASIEELAFVVAFEGGERFKVTPTGLAKPLLLTDLNGAAPK